MAALHLTEARHGTQYFCIVYVVEDNGRALTIGADAANLLLALEFEPVKGWGEKEKEKERERERSTSMMI